MDLHHVIKNAVEFDHDNRDLFVCMLLIDFDLRLLNVATFYSLNIRSVTEERDEKYNLQCDKMRSEYSLERRLQ